MKSAGTLFACSPLQRHRQTPFHHEQSSPTLGFMVEPSPVVRGMAYHSTCDGALWLSLTCAKNLANFLIEIKNKTLSSCLQVCLARQWDMPTTLHRKYSIKKPNKQKNRCKISLVARFYRVYKTYRGYRCCAVLGFFWDWGGDLFEIWEKMCIFVGWRDMNKNLRGGDASPKSFKSLW